VTNLVQFFLSDEANILRFYDHLDDRSFTFVLLTSLPVKVCSYRLRCSLTVKMLLSSSLRMTFFTLRLHLQPPVRQRPRLVLQHTSSLPMLATPVL